VDDGDSALDHPLDDATVRISAVGK
jgi:hypothetical protein